MKSMKGLNLDVGNPFSYFDVSARSMMYHDIYIDFEKERKHIHSEDSSNALAGVSYKAVRLGLLTKV